MKYLLLILFLPFSVCAQTYLKTSGIGTEVNGVPVTISNITTGFPMPQDGTILHIVSSGITINPRISLDAYNGANVLGSSFQGRRSGGNANSPSSALADYTLANFSGDGYGLTGFHNVSLAAMSLKSEGTMTDASAPTYISFFSTPSGSIAASERLRIKSTGVVQITGLNSVGIVQTDVNGNLSTAALNSGNITTALGYTPLNTAYVAKTANYTMTASDWTVNCTTGTFTITLPDATTIAVGKTFNIKNSGSGTITTNCTGGQLIDGQSSQTITQYSNMQVQNTGSGFIIL